MFADRRFFAYVCSLTAAAESCAWQNANLFLYVNFNRDLVEGFRLTPSQTARSDFYANARITHKGL